MPVASSFSELKQALRDRETNITRALDDLFKDQAHRQAVRDHPNYGNFKNDAYVLSSEPGDKIPDWAKDVLVGPLVTKNLDSKELDHLDHWPPQQRENLRQRMVNALEQDVPLKFHWELYGGETEVTDLSQEGVVVFRSPQKNLEFSGITLAASTKVKVGP